MRYRNKTLVFKQSCREKNRTDNLIYLSGMGKQEYILHRLFDEDVVAVPNVRVQKHIRELLTRMSTALEEYAVYEDPLAEDIEELVAVITLMLQEMRGEKDYA